MSLTFACQSVRWSSILGLCIHLLVYSLFMYSDCCTQISHPPAIDIQCRWVKLLSRIFQLKIAWLQCTLPRLIRQSSYYTSPSAVRWMNHWTRILCLGWNLWRDIHTKYIAAYRHPMFNSPTRLASTRSFVHTHISCSSLTIIQPSFHSDGLQHAEQISEFSLIGNTPVQS